MIGDCVGELDVDPSEVILESTVDRGVVAIRTVNGVWVMVGLIGRAVTEGEIIDGTRDVDSI